MVIDGDLTSKHGAITGISKLKRLGLDCSWGAGLGLFSWISLRDSDLQKLISWDMGRLQLWWNITHQWNCNEKTTVKIEWSIQKQECYRQEKEINHHFAYVFFFRNQKLIVKHRDLISHHVLDKPRSWVNPRINIGRGTMMVDYCILGHPIFGQRSPKQGGGGCWKGSVLVGRVRLLLDYCTTCDDLSMNGSLYSRGWID